MAAERGGSPPTILGLYDEVRSLFRTALLASDSLIRTGTSYIWAALLPLTFRPLD